MLTLANSANTKLDLRTLGDPKPTWPTEIKTATEWFCRMFPTQTKVFGSPFLEESGLDSLGLTISIPVVPNIDCLAACLGGDQRLGHRVIYYAKELQFYYYDPVDQMYHATTSEKLENFYRALMARCAAEVKNSGHILNTFYTFRSDDVAKAVVKRARSLLAASEDFFGVKSPYARTVGPEIHQRLALVFAERLLQPCAGSILTIGQTFELFNQFAATKDMPAIKRCDFKSLMGETIREIYDLGVRNDLMNVETHKQQCGWLGLRPVAVP